MELLISISLFATITTIIISVLFTSFRASRKSEVIVATKQNGNLVLGRIVNGIRFARSLDDPASCVPSVEQSSITISDYHGYQTTYSCPDDATGNTTISSNSAALVDTSVYTVAACTFVCSQTTDNDPPTIKISFILSTANPSNPSNLVETTSTIPFTTSVIMRNFSR